MSEDHPSSGDLGPGEADGPRSSRPPSSRPPEPAGITSPDAADAAATSDVADAADGTDGGENGDAGEAIAVAAPPRTAEETPSDVAARIEEIPASDAAEVLEELPAEAAADVAEYLDPETAGRILSEMDPQRAGSILSDMEAPEASMVVSAMAPDDRVDVLEHVPDEQHDAILGEMDAEDAADVLELEKYDPDTAGGIMTSEVTALSEDMTIEQAVAELRRLSEEREQMWYVYVVDRRHHLVGVLSVRDLLLGRPDRRLRQIMRTQLTTVLATMDQEEVARLFRRYNYLAMPVVDARHRLVGLITWDDVADVIEEESTEDLLKLFGAGARERLTSPWPFSFGKRIGWLEVRLVTAFAGAFLIAAFDGTIHKAPVLAACLAVVSALGGTAGAQAMAVAVRGIASGAVERRTLYRFVYREAWVGLLTGLVVGGTAAAIASLGGLGHRDLFSYRPAALAAVLAAALTINHLIACVFGVAIPICLKRLRLDPAQAATIWVTTVTDCCGFLATLGIAALCIRWLV